MADADFIATIKANGSIYNAWENVSIRRDYGNAISVFEFSPVEGSYGPNNGALKLQPGDKVQIYLAGQLALTGAVTTRSVAYDERSHQVIIAGKSLTHEAKESAVVIKPGNYNGSTFEQAAKGVLAPHGINLVMLNPGDAASKPFKSLAVQYGETVAAFISRMAMMRGLFLNDDVNGNLVASQLKSDSAPVATFVEGQNIIRATAKMDNQGVAGQYQGVSQHPGDDNNWPPRAVSASTTQTAGPPNRKRLFISEHPADASDLTARVEHESAVSAWPLFSCSITTPGWLTPDGKLWDPTTMTVTVYSPMLFPTQTATVKLGIQSVTFNQDSQNGTTTTLEMTLPQLLSETASSGAEDVGSEKISNKPAQPDPPDTDLTK